jgi:PBP1b-binding outer membrane lipoprotein LpoB
VFKSKLGKLPSTGALVLVTASALLLSACSGATPNSTQKTAGPSAWTDTQKKYLDSINGAHLAASVFMSATDYITVGNTVCQSLKQNISLEDVLSALATSGMQNGLNETQRTDFSLITSAAAVTFLCTDQKPKYKRAN